MHPTRWAVFFLIMLSSCILRAANQPCPTPGSSATSSVILDGTYNRCFINAGTVTINANASVNHSSITCKTLTANSGVTMESTTVTCDSVSLASNIKLTSTQAYVTNLCLTGTGYYTFLGSAFSGTNTNVSRSFIKDTCDAQTVIFQNYETDSGC